jgi:hypothetical protein
MVVGLGSAASPLFFEAGSNSYRVSVFDPSKSSCRVVLQEISVDSVDFQGFQNTLGKPTRHEISLDSPDEQAEARAATARRGGSTRSPWPDALDRINNCSQKG